jgi:two-component system NtrC family sensor kinase
MIAVLAVSGYLRVRRELDAFAADMIRDHAVVARGLDSAIIAAYQAGRRGPALRAIAESASDDRVRVRWLEPSPGVEHGQRDWRVSRYPVFMDGKRLGTLEVAEARGEERAYVSSTIVQTVLSTGLLAAIALAIIMGLTLWLVGRPIRLLRDKMKRIGGGDFGGPLLLHQRDEVGELARDMNVMCERLLEARHRIQTEVDGRLRAIEQLRHADRLATVGRLASGVAHELGTPLSVVLARARMVQNGEVAPAELSTYGRIIAEQVERMRVIIRQLLDFSRRQRRGPGMVALEREAVDLNDLIARTRALVEPLAEKRQVQLVLDEAEHVVAPVDPALVQQVVLNLLTNALQAMARPGTVRLSVYRDHATAPAGVEAATGDYARLTVEDKGQGIDPAILPRVFEPFFTTKDVGEGTGLGLSVSYGIVREHGGWIEVDSHVGEGSRFSVFLPLEARAS